MTLPGRYSLQLESHFESFELLAYFVSEMKYQELSGLRACEMNPLNVHPASFRKNRKISYLRSQPHAKLIVAFPSPLCLSLLSTTGAAQGFVHIGLL